MSDLRCGACGSNVTGMTEAQRHALRSDGTRACQTAGGMIITSPMLAGLTITTTSGTTVYFQAPPDDDDPLAGVGEPRRPLPNEPGPLTAVEQFKHDYAAYGQAHIVVGRKRI